MGLPELALKIIFCLLLAGLIGWIIGFLLGRIFGSVNATELLNDCEGKMRVRDQELGGLRIDLSSATGKIGSLETELATLATTLRTREGWVTELEAKSLVLQDDLDARISELDELKAESEKSKAALNAQLEAASAQANSEVNSRRAQLAATDAAAQAAPSTLSGDAAGAVRSQLNDRNAEIAHLKIYITELELMIREVKEPVVKVSPASSLPPSSNERDDLKKIFGIGPVLETLLNSHGIYWFRQIAKWTTEDVQHYDHLLEDFRGRIERDDWIIGAQQEQQRKYGDQL